MYSCANLDCNTSVRRFNAGGHTIYIRGTRWAVQIFLNALQNENTFIEKNRNYNVQANGSSSRNNHYCSCGTKVPGAISA